MTIESIIIIFLLTTVLCAIAVIGNNIDHYSGTSVSADDFLRLYEKLNKPPVFRKKLFHRTYLVIIHEGFFIGTQEKNFSEDKRNELNPFNCSRKN